MQKNITGSSSPCDRHVRLLTKKDKGRISGQEEEEEEVEEGNGDGSSTVSD